MEGGFWRGFFVGKVGFGKGAYVMLPLFCGHSLKLPAGMLPDCSGRFVYIACVGLYGIHQSPPDYSCVDLYSRVGL